MSLDGALVLSWSWIGRSYRGLLTSWPSVLLTPLLVLSGFQLHGQNPSNARLTFNNSCMSSHKMIFMCLPDLPNKIKLRAVTVTVNMSDLLSPFCGCDSGDVSLIKASTGTTRSRCIHLAFFWSKTPRSARALLPHTAGLMAPICSNTAAL